MYNHHTLIIWNVWKKSSGIHVSYIAESHSVMIKRKFTRIFSEPKAEIIQIRKNHSFNECFSNPNRMIYNERRLKSTKREECEEKIVNLFDVFFYTSIRKCIFIYVWINTDKWKAKKCNKLKTLISCLVFPNTSTKKTYCFFFQKNWCYIY